MVTPTQVPKTGKLDRREKFYQKLLLLLTDLQPGVRLGRSFQNVIRHSMIAFRRCDAAFRNPACLSLLRFELVKLLAEVV
jgi:hypothetical protein